MRTSLAAILILFAGLPVRAQNSAEALLRKIDGHYNHLSSLETTYSEHYTGMGMDRTESGTLLLKKPGRMRWNYNTPAGKLFILDGKDGYFYTPGDAQAQKIPAKQLDDLRSPLRFLLGHTQLQKELQDVHVTAVPGGYQVAGVPKGMDQRVKQLTLNVDTQGLIIGMKIEEIEGAVTDFTFSDMRENVPIKDSEFVFTPPPGVTIVHGLPPI